MYLFFSATLPRLFPMVNQEIPQKVAKQKNHYPHIRLFISKTERTEKEKIRGATEA